MFTIEAMSDTTRLAAPAGQHRVSSCGRHRRFHGFLVGRRPRPVLVVGLTVAVAVAVGATGFGPVPVRSVLASGAVVMPTADGSNAPASGTIQEAVAALAVAAEVNEGYDRDLFHYGLDEDGNGCDTRREVLLAEATVTPIVTGDCDIAGGQWYSYYENETYEDASLVEVDHLVPLAEAWGSGAYRWAPATRQAFANDLGDPRTLAAVGTAVNQDKGAQDVAGWLPPFADAQCRYLHDWVAVKTRWRLSVDEAEKTSLQTLAARCADTPFAAVAVANTGSPAGSASQPLAFEMFVGEWDVHGNAVEIRSDKTGTSIWNAGPCHLNLDPAAPEPLCMGTATFTLTEQATGLMGTYDSVVYTDPDGAVVADYDDLGEGPRVGQTFTVEQVTDGVLYRTHDPDIVLGNPYLCGPTASAEWRARC
ncbi:HNH endonuclease family protein [Micromonospora sp. CPCC 206061]|uniref:HNH endonuclease family protein n=1 Tax=Micromonospora sp. CPCC 206061 TaxID=3122410 RepID=UPI002FEE6D9D